MCLNVCKSFPSGETTLNETSASVFHDSVLFKHPVDSFHFKCIHDRVCTRVHSFRVDLIGNVFS